MVVSGARILCDCGIVESVLIVYRSHMYTCTGNTPVYTCTGHSAGVQITTAQLSNHTGHGTHLRQSNNVDQMLLDQHMV